MIGAVASATGEAEERKRANEEASVLTGAAVLLFGTALTSTASAQAEPLCGPPGEEQPATIVGAGQIVGTSGNDLIDGGTGIDVLVGDSTEHPPFLPSNGTNKDHLIGGSAVTTCSAWAETMSSRAARATTN